MKGKMKYIVVCIFGCMLFKMAGAQDNVDARIQQYVQGEGYVLYNSYPASEEPMRMGPGQTQLMPREVPAPYEYKYDEKYNYTNLNLNPEYNRGAIEQELKDEEYNPPYKPVSETRSTYYKAQSNVRVTVTKK